MTMLSKGTKESAFKKWKKNAFRVEFLRRLQQSLLFPNQVATARACLHKWSKLAKFNKRKQFFASEVEILRDYNTRRRIFTDWFNTAMRSAPVTLFCNRIERA